MESKNRIYIREESIVFCKTKEKYGGLSNMAAGFPIQVNGIDIRTSEAIYQACRFPNLPDIQRLIIDQVSPMTAKDVMKPHRENSRPDWDAVSIKVMRWSLRVKLAQNMGKFGDLLLSTGNLSIVEESFKDDFWGAKRTFDGRLIGMNVLGRLLMELREELKSNKILTSVEPLQINDFLLFGEQILKIQPVKKNKADIVEKQMSLFDDDAFDLPNLNRF